MSEFLKENAMFIVGSVVFLGLMIGVSHKPAGTSVIVTNTDTSVAIEPQTTTPKTNPSQIIPAKIRRYSDDNEMEESE